MDILLISNEDTCRSRIAQELLHAFGRGMNISTAGIMEGNCVPDAVCNVMEQNGFSVSRKKPSGVGTYTHRSWVFKMKVSRSNKLPHSMKPCTGGCMNFTAMN